MKKNSIYGLQNDRMSLHQSRRGSAMILVISVIVFLLLIGLSLVTITEHQSYAASASAKGIQTDNALDQAASTIKEVIDQDWRTSIEHPLPVAGMDMETYKRGNTSLQPATTSAAGYHAFLAATAPLEPVLGGNWATWQQISNIINSGNVSNDYINIDTMTNQTSVTDQTLPYAVPTTANDFLMADADGDGIYDSRWCLLPIPTANRVKWVAGVRIIDNSSMVNINTACVLHSDATGATPSDVSLYDLLVTTDGSPTTWGTGFDPLTVLVGAGDYQTPNTTWEKYFTGRGLAYTAGSTATERQTNWTDLGSVLGRFLHTTSGTPTANKVAFGWDTELELRLNNSTNSYSRSPFELAIEGATAPTTWATNGPVRSYRDTTSPTLINANFTRLRADRRRLLTAYNATRNIKVWTDYNHDSAVTADEVKYRKPMPPYLDLLISPVSVADYTTYNAAVNTAFGSPVYSNAYGNSFDPSITDQTVPPYKLNPSWDTTNNRVTDSLAKLGVAFSAILASQGSYPFPSSTLGTGATVLGGVTSGFALAANIQTYQSTDVYDNTNSAVYIPTAGTSVVMYGVKRQPFFKEVNTMVIYEDRRNAATPPSNSGSPTDMGLDAGGDNDGKIQFNPAVASTELIGRYLTIELGNPFPTGQDINLTHFYLRVNGAAGLIPLSGTIPGNNGNIIIYTSNGTIEAGTTDGAAATRPFNKFSPIAVATGTDADVASMISGITPAPSVTLPVDPTTFPSYDFKAYTTAVAGSGNLYVEIIYAPSLASANVISVGDKFVIVDSIGADKSHWAAPVLTADKPLGVSGGATEEGKRWIVSRSIARDDNTPATVGGCPNYIFADDPDYSSEADAGGNIEKIYGFDANGNQPARGTALSAANLTKLTGSTTILGSTDPAWLSPSTGAAETNAPPNARTKPFVFNIRNAPMTTVGEIASILTVGHYRLATGQSYPVSSMLGRLLVQKPVSSADPGVSLSPDSVVVDGYKDEELGYLHFFNDKVHTLGPAITSAMTIFDAVDMVAPAANEPKTYGQINPNTAPREVQEALPFLVPTSGLGGLPNPFNAATGIVSYREKSTGLYPTDRATTSTLVGLRAGETATTDLNFVSMGELLAVRGNPATVPGSTSFIDYLGRDGTVAAPLNNNSAVNPLFPIVDNGSNDNVERNAVFQKLGNTIDMRSDVFTAYVLLQGMKPDPANSGHYIVSAKRRFVMTVDRAEELYSGTDAVELAGSVTSLSNTFSNDALGCTAYLFYRGNNLGDPDSRAYKGVVSSVSANTFTLAPASIVDFTSGPAHGTSLPTSTGTPITAKFNFVIVGKPKVTMFAQDR